ncbi:MAG: PTS sugar transporter subunit IIA [Sebaldella sp.]|nr:PTS sugar transporter subunit IIA [Sebaldella sp.]
MFVSSRTIKILEYISKKEEITIKDISKNLFLSERIIRYEIDNINSIVSLNNISAQIINKRGRLKIFDISKSLEIIKTLKEVEKVSKEEREDYILIKLLFEGKINLKKLTDELNVSRTTIKNDLFSSEKRVEKEGIKLVNNSLYFTKNDELTKRKILINFLYRYIEDFINGIENSMVISYLNNFFTSSELLLVERFLKNISEHNLKSNELYKTFYMYLIITIQRIKTNNLILKNENSNFLKTTQEFKKINKEIVFLEKNLGILFDENEKLQIADFLIGLFSYSYNTSIFDVWIKVNMFIKEMIKNVGEKLDTNIINDSQLLEGLMNHIKPTIYRIRNNIILENMEIYYNEAKNIYPKLFGVIKKELKSLENLIDIEFPENEFLLFVIHFQAAMERNLNIKNKVRNVILVCIGGYGTTNILTYKLKKIYDLDKIKIISYLDINNSYEDIDAIVTTVDLNINIKENITIPIIRVSPFLTEKDITNLNTNGFSRKKDKYFLTEVMEKLKESININDIEKFSNDLQSMFNISIQIDNFEKKDIFYFLKEENILYEKHEIENWETAIKLGFTPLIKGDYINESYYKNIIELINNFGPYMVVSEGLAIPHAENINNIYKSGMSLLYLKNPVIFPKNKKVNLLFCLSAINKKDHIQSLEDILILEEEFSFRKKLENISSKEEILEILNEYKKLRR